MRDLPGRVTPDCASHVEKAVKFAYADDIKRRLDELGTEAPIAHPARRRQDSQRAYTAIATSPALLSFSKTLLASCKVCAFAVLARYLIMGLHFKLASDFSVLAACCDKSGADDSPSLGGERSRINEAPTRLQGGRCSSRSIESEMN